MALSKNRADEIEHNEQPPPRKLAAIVGCDPGEVESIALLLDLLGWEVATFDTADQISVSQARLAFFDADANTPAAIAKAVDRIGASQPVLALLGSEDNLSAHGTILNFNLQGLVRPIDLELVERVIEQAS